MTPPKEFRKEYAHELLRIAEGDYESASGLAKLNVGRPENICYHAQQVVEKSLKSVLCWKVRSFPLVHDLGVSLGKFDEADLPPHGYALISLTEYGSVRRYEEGVSNLTADEIASALGAALDVLTWAKSLTK